MNAYQIDLLKHYGLEIEMNQLELSLKKIDFIDQGIMVNHPGHNQVDISSGIMTYMQKNKMRVQAWGSLAQGIYSRDESPYDTPEIIKTRAYVKQLADEKNVTTEAIALAWLMKHPIGIEPIIGSKTPGRILNCRNAQLVELSRLEWYTLLTYSRGNMIP